MYATARITPLLSCDPTVLTRTITIIACAASLLLAGGAAFFVRASSRAKSPEVERLTQLQQTLEKQGQLLERLGREREQRDRRALEAAARVEQPLGSRAGAEAPAPPSPAGAVEPTAPAVAEASIEQLELEQASRELLEAAVKAGTWSDSELSQFSKQFRRLTRLQQAGLAQSLSVAINEGKIRVDPSRMPL